MSTEFQRAIVYIDGFNLYFGMKERRWARYYWLDLWSLCTRLVRPTQKLLTVKYFTSRVSATPSDPAKVTRQNSYLEALSTLPNVDIRYGHYLQDSIRCRKCGASWSHPREKMTDVNISVEMLKDAFQDAFDVAILVSADSDLVPALRETRQLFPDKRIVVAFPPKRHSKNLKANAHAYFSISRSMLAKSQFPEVITTKKGIALKRPEKWQPLK